MPTPKRVSFAVSEDFHNHVKALADAEGRELSNYLQFHVPKAINQYVAVKTTRSLVGVTDNTAGNAKDLPSTTAFNS